MLITLITWAENEIETPPPYRTLCQWAKNGQISGAVKMGRKWMCRHDSVYIELKPASIPADVSGRVADILNRRAA